MSAANRLLTAVRRVHMTPRERDELAQKLRGRTAAQIFALDLRRDLDARAAGAADAAAGRDFDPADHEPLYYVVGFMSARRRGG